MKSWNLAFLFLLASVPALADPADWSYRAPILPVEPLADRLVEFPLTPEVFDAAQPDLSDLRVMSDSGLEAGHVIRVLEGSYRELQLEGRLFDRTFVPGSRASAILDFGSRILKNRIRVDTTGTEFRRTVRVEGSQDATTWERLREGAVLYRLPASEDARRVDLGLVSLPQNDFRYLRVSVFPGRDDAGEFRIVDIRSSREESVPPGLVEVPARSFEVVPDRGASDLHVDLGFRNLPLYELTLRVRDRQFYRNVTLFGRNAAERTVPTRNEDGRETTRVEAEPWHRMTSGVVHRFTADDEND